MHRKLFLGLPIKKRVEEVPNLQQIAHHGQTYIGRTIHAAQISLQELEQQQIQLKRELLALYPNDPIHLHIFPQIFIE